MSPVNNGRIIGGVLVAGGLRIGLGPVRRGGVNNGCPEIKSPGMSKSNILVTFFGN